MDIIISNLRMTEIVFETLVFSLFNHLNRPIVRQNFIILSRRESNRSYSIDFLL